MLKRLRQRRIIDIGLNVVFGVWVTYFIITGYVIPRPLVRHAIRPPAIEQQEVDPAPEIAPVLVIDQDS